jgi:polyhydroxyalkanoate synthesis repressor PhaR
MAILIKRYANRKLYNTSTSRYITLKGIAELIDAGQEIRVIDNETGEDITSVALSQILVDTERSNTRASDSLLSQIMGRGGDALYGALRRGVDDATESFGGIQDRVRRMVGNADHGRDRSEPDRRKLSNWIAYAAPDFDHMVQKAVERVFEVLDLPRRSDVDALNHNLERVATAVETLEKALARRETVPPPSDSNQRE